MDTGVAKRPIADFEKYRDELEARLGKSREVMPILHQQSEE